MSRRVIKKSESLNWYQAAMRTLLIALGVVDATAVAAAIKTDPALLSDPNIAPQLAGNTPDPEAALDAHLQAQDIREAAEELKVPETTPANLPLEDIEIDLKAQPTEISSLQEIPDADISHSKPAAEPTVTETQITTYTAQPDISPSPEVRHEAQLTEKAPDEESVTRDASEKANLEPSASAPAEKSHMKTFMENLEKKLGPVIAENEAAIIACSAGFTSAGVSALYLHYIHGQTRNMRTLEELEEDLRSPADVAGYKYQQKSQEREMVV